MSNADPIAAAAPPNRFATRTEEAVARAEACVLAARGRTDPPALSEARIAALLAWSLRRLKLRGELMEKFLGRRWGDVREGTLHPDDLVDAIELAPAYIDPEYHPARLLGYGIELLGRARKEGRR